MTVAHLAKAGLLGLIVCCLLASCGSTPAADGSRSPGGSPPSADQRAAQSTLDALTDAVTQRDRATFDRQISTLDPAFPAVARTMFDNLSGLPLTRLNLDVLPLQRDLSDRRRALLGGRAFVRQVEVTWQVTGDSGPAETLLWLTFAATGGQTRLAAATDGPDQPSPQPFWLVEPISARRGRHATVLTAEPGNLAAWTRRADSASVAVRPRLLSGLGAGWNGDVVLEVPSTRGEFERILGVTPGSYAGIAAVAWPEGPDPETAAIRIIVNPELAGTLDEQRLAVLLTHESVHVATRSAASAAPTWLVEGFADFVAYDAHPRTAPAAEVALLTQVRAGHPPTALPANSKLVPSNPSLPLRYAEAWSACRFLAETFGPARLAAFYRLVSAGATVNVASRSEFGLGVDQLTSQWRQYLESTARKS